MRVTIILIPRCLLAISCNMFLEILGWTVERLWKERPLEQYPDHDNSMARWMLDSGILEVLGVDPSIPEPPPPAPLALTKPLSLDPNGKPPPKPRASRAKPKPVVEAGISDPVVAPVRYVAAAPMANDLLTANP